MTVPDEIRRELSALCWSLSDGSFLPADVERLEGLSQQYPEVHALYAQFMVMCGLLQWEQQGAGGRDQGSGSVAPRSFSALPSRFFPLGFLPAGALVSYLVAAMVFLTGTLAAWTWETNTVFPPVAGVSPPGVAAAEPPGPYVARITKLVDCRRDPKSAAVDGQLVRLGYSFVMPHGTAEITYDSGAVVTLRAPAEYSVNAVNGGGLMCGAATVRAGTRDLASPFVVLSPATKFSIDAGGEASLSIDRSWGSFTNVVRGAVRIEMPNCSPAETTVLGANQSALVSVERLADGSGRWALQRWDSAPSRVAEGRLPKQPLVADDYRKERSRPTGQKNYEKTQIEQFPGT